MTSPLLLKRLASSTLRPRSLSRTITLIATSAYHFFNTNAIPQYDNEFDDRDLDVDHRSVSRCHDFFSSMHVFDPFSPIRSLSQVLNLVDQKTKNPFFAGTRGSIRRGWDAKDMSSLGKEDTKVSVEQNTLAIKSERAKKGDDEESVRRYTSRIDLSEKMYKTSEIKAEMENSVLKVVVPKVKEKEMSDMFHVNIE